MYNFLIHPLEGPHIFTSRIPRSLAITALLFSVLSLSACSVAPPEGVTPVRGFQLERYLGTWYEIARLDHSFERKLDNVSARYSLRSDGDVQVINAGYRTDSGRRKEAVGVAKFIGAQDVGSLKVSFFGPFYGGYHVVELDEEYRWALVVGQNHKYMWILAREKELPQSIVDQLLAKAEALGFDTSELIWVEHDRADT